MRNAVRIMLLLFLLPTVAAAAPTIRFDDEAVVVEGATAGGSVAVLGVGRETAGFLSHQLSVWETVTADATGVARLELGRPIPEVSTWAAVDLGDGEIALAAPAGTPLREVSFPQRGLPADLRSLDDARSSLAVLWVRPASQGEAGAWGGAVSDGSDRDGDGAENRGLRVLLDSLEPLGASPEPSRSVAPGDVLVGIDTTTLDVYAVRLVR